MSAMNSELSVALKDIIREQAIKKDSVKIEGLGTFKPVHKKQHQEMDKNGKIILIPPQDQIHFIPEEK